MSRLWRQTRAAPTKSVTHHFERHLRPHALCVRVDLSVLLRASGCQWQLDLDVNSTPEGRPMTLREGVHSHGFPRIVHGRSAKVARIHLKRHHERQWCVLQRDSFTILSEKQPNCEVQSSDSMCEEHEISHKRHGPTFVNLAALGSQNMSSSSCSGCHLAAAGPLCSKGTIAMDTRADSGSKSRFTMSTVPSSTNLKPYRPCNFSSSCNGIRKHRHMFVSTDA